MTNSPDSTSSQPDSGAFSEFSTSSNRKVFGTAMTVLVSACTVIVLLPLLAIIINVITKGVARLDLEALTELPPPPLVDGGGFRNAIVGTLVTVTIGALLSVPFGILAAIYLSEFGRGTKFANFTRFCTNVLSGVPSIICGLFAYAIVVLTTGTFSAVAGGVALSVLMVPIVVRTVEEGLKSIPRDIRLAAVGVGATNFQMIAGVILPAVLPALATGVTLSVARASGETAPLLFTALFNQYGMDSVWQPVASMSVMIYTYAISPYQNQQTLAWAASLILVLLVLAVSVLSRYMTRRKIY